MTGNEILVYGLLIANYIIAFLYLIINLIIRKENDRARVVITFIVMCLCPVIGIIIFAVAVIAKRIFFRKEVDLSDVIFGKEKADSYDKGDELAEKNMVPLEEALIVTDKQNLRELMINIIKGDVSEHLKAISQALNNEDSETAHYAASVLRDELNEFRTTVQNIYIEVKKNPGELSENSISDIHVLIKYMNVYLVQNVFADMEQISFVEIIDEILEKMYAQNPDEVTVDEMECVALRHLDCNRYEICEKWASRSKEHYPMELSSYTISLKLYFKTNDRERFFEEVENLKASEVVIDRETLEIIRAFAKDKEGDN